MLVPYWPPSMTGLSRASLGPVGDPGGWLSFEWLLFCGQLWVFLAQEALLRCPWREG